jgi:hypothetical protein
MIAFHRRLGEFLHHWLVDHILRDDLLMKPFADELRLHAVGLGPLEEHKAPPKRLRRRANEAEQQITAAWDQPSGRSTCRQSLRHGSEFCRGHGIEVERHVQLAVIRGTHAERQGGIEASHRE